MEFKEKKMMVFEEKNIMIFCYIKHYFAQISFVLFTKLFMQNIRRFCRGTWFLCRRAHNETNEIGIFTDLHFFLIVIIFWAYAELN